MLLLIIFGILCQLTFGAQVQTCKAVKYYGAVVGKDSNWNPLTTVYTYNFKLKVSVDSANQTYPNTVTVSDFVDWSFNTSAFYRTSPLRFAYGYSSSYIYFSNYIVNCKYFNETCVFSYPNGQISRHFYLHYGNYGSIDVYNGSPLIINEGFILGGDQGFVMDQTNPCINGVLWNENVGKYNYESNTTVCCIEYDYVEVPDNTELVCEQFVSVASIIDNSQNFNLDNIMVVYDISLSNDSYTNISLYTSQTLMSYYNFKYQVSNFDICSDLSQPCQALLIGHQNLQWDFILNLSPNYYGIILGEINRRNGTFLKSNYEHFTPSDPCSQRLSDVAFSNATYSSSFCCTKFKGDSQTTTTTSTTTTYTTKTTTTTTVQSTITTTMSLSATTLSTDPRSDYIGTPCSTDISQAWLDIVFVVDTSKLMTKPQLQQLSAQISTYMQGFTFAQIGQHTVRAAIIVYSTQVTTIYQLTDTTDFDAFVDAIYELEDYANPEDEGGNLQGALQAAYNLSISQKSQRRPLIVLIAAAYNPTGFQGADLTANTITANGICIVVINFKSSQGVLATALQNISCTGYYYISDDFDLESKFRYALTQLNCICPQGSLQFREYNTAWQNFTNYADCMYGYQTPTAPKFAERSCNPGTLAAVTSQSKLDFITDNVLPYVMPKEKKFTIGLHKSDINEEWNWWGYNKTEYALGEYPTMADPPAVGDNYGYMWNHYGFNWTLQTGNNIPLPYICQSHACDAEFICDMTPAKSVLRD